MKIRADLVELLHQGHSNLAIADMLRVDRKTVAAARDALRMPAAPNRRPMTARERLLLEAAPTGKVRDYDRRREPITAQQAAANRRVLERAIARGETHVAGRHLHAVPETTKDAA